MMPADETGTSNLQHHQYTDDSEDESSHTPDKLHEAFDEHNATQEYASLRPADEHAHSNSALRQSSAVRALTPTPLETSKQKKRKEEVVTWTSLPHKRQLAVLTAARLSEPLVQSSLQSYMFYQLKSFDKNLPDSVIASQAGIMQGSFTAAQFLTAVMWGRIADSDRGGRKTVIMIGLLGTCKWLAKFARAPVRC
jgi:hypothetical protein